MKKIEANIPTFRLVEVREALAVLGMFDFLAIDANDVAPAAGLIELHRGLEAESDLRPVLRLEILVEDDLIRPAIAAIASGVAGLRDWDLPGSHRYPERHDHRRYSTWCSAIYRVDAADPDFPSLDRPQ